LQTARIGFKVTPGGVHDYLARLKLNPHQTRAINIRQLRDAQLADFRKNVIPADTTEGTVSWGRIDNVPVSGPGSNNRRRQNESLTAQNILPIVQFYS
jgi:hypothetical protein